MKKAGSSSSKSRTRRTSTNSPEREVAQALSVGHNPGPALAPSDEALFRAFQSNLLSLVSHELRTPLTGILNALGLLEEGALGEFSAAELVKMARQNAQRLNQALAALLDVAALESGTFHARLREVDLQKLVAARASAYASLLKDRELGLARESAGEKGAVAVLADPQKLGRALDLCFQLLIPRAEAGSTINLRISSTRVTFSFALTEAAAELWDAAWMQAVAGFQGGVASPASAFSGALQSEQAFLTRTEEGLGSELMLVHEILRLHQGRFEARHEKGREITLALTLPELSSEEGVRAVLASRAYEVSTDLASVALVLINVPSSGTATGFRDRIRASLFRTTDAVYSLPARGQLALVLDDCKAEDVPRMLKRVEGAAGGALIYGFAHCPADGTDPSRLPEIAEARLAQALRQKKA